MCFVAVKLTIFRKRKISGCLAKMWPAVVVALLLAIIRRHYTTTAECTHTIGVQLYPRTFGGCVN